MIHGPRTSNSPTVSPSLASTVPSSAQMRTSTPGTMRPVLARHSISSSGAAWRGGVASAHSGLVSVMPQPWTSSTPSSSRNRSMSWRGTAAPPAVIMRRDDRSTGLDWA